MLYASKASVWSDREKPHTQVYIRQLGEYGRSAIYCCKLTRKQRKPHESQNVRGFSILATMMIGRVLDTIMTFIVHRFHCLVFRSMLAAREKKWSRLDRLDMRALIREDDSSG